MKKLNVAIVVAMDKNRLIGKSGDLPWNIPEDRKRFKDLTMGHAVIMGRKTFESILKYIHKPLPGRTNIIVTRDQSYTADGCIVCHTLEDALKKATKIEEQNPNPEVHIGGGAELYKQVLPFVDKLYLSIVEGDYQGDAYFPDYSMFKKVVRNEQKTSNGYLYTILDLER
nr:Dihydrofolate reductase [uncultured bacterium]